MSDEEALKTVCELGRRIEQEAKDAEAEAYFRTWKPAPDGGHDAGFVRQLQDSTSDTGGLVRDVLPKDKRKNGKNTGGTEI